MKGLYKALEDLVWLTQLGLSILLPLLMCLGGCWWATNRWGWPMWVYLPGIVLGLAAGAKKLLGVCQGAAGPRQTGAPPPGGVQFASMSVEVCYETAAGIQKRNCCASPGALHCVPWRCG